LILFILGIVIGVLLQRFILGKIKDNYNKNGVQKKDQIDKKTELKKEKLNKNTKQIKINKKSDLKKESKKD